MKIYILVLCLIAASLAYYTDIDPNFDYVGLISNLDKEKTFMDCFVDIGPCSDVMLKFKGHILETVQDACKECTDTQKHAYHLFLASFRKVYPEEYNQFKVKYDLDGKHLNLLEKELDKY